MSNEPIGREECLIKEKEHRDAITRVHERVDNVENTAASIAASAKFMSDAVIEIKKMMNGDVNADGLITKVSNLKQKVDGIFWFSGIVIIAVVGVLVSMVFNK